MAQVGFELPLVKTLLNDHMLKVRKATKADWIAANQNNKNVRIDKIVSMIAINISREVQRELALSVNHRLP